MNPPSPSQLQREVWLLVPTVLGLLVVLSLVALYSYRSGIQQILDETRESVLRRASVAATAAVTSESIVELRLLAPRAAAVAIVDDLGRVLQSAGEPMPFARPPGAAGSVSGPSDALPDRVVAFAPIPEPGTRFLRLDVEATTLARHLRTLRVLTPMVLIGDLALPLLVFVFLRRFLGPYERLLARLGTVSASSPSEEGETARLYEAFDRAMEQLGRDRADEAMAAIEQSLSGSTGSGLMLIDDQQRMLATNPSAEKLLGATAAGLPDLLDNVLAHRPGLLRELRTHLAAGRDSSFASPPEDPPAAKLALTVHPLQRADGSRRGWLVLLVDWNAARQAAAESQLARTLADLGELSAGVAHELRNSVATVKGYLSLFERSRDEQHLREIRDELQQLERVVRDFLSFARPGHSSARPVPLVPLLERLVSDPAFGTSRAISLRIDAASPPPTLRGDEQLLYRAFSNLVSNAVRAASPGAVEVVLLASEDVCEVSILDRGPGLPDGPVDRLLQPFVTASAGGTGLGLSVAQRIFSLHDAALELRPRAGGGAEARVAFPPHTIVTDRSRHDSEATATSSRSRGTRGGKART